MNTFLLLQITFGIIIGKCIVENAALFNLIVFRSSAVHKCSTTGLGCVNESASDSAH